MASTKYPVDFSDFANSREANKLAGNAVRKALEYDAYAGKNSFIALVLTNPSRLTTGEAAYTSGAPQPSVGDKMKNSVGLQGTNKKIGKIQFRARILGPNSPHAFIPNPCESKEFAEETLGAEYEETRMKLISMHTMFYTVEDFSIGSGLGYPAVNTLVEVFLDRGADGAFNLQKGRFEGTVVNAEDVKQTLATFEIPWALAGGGAKYAYNNPVRKKQALPNWALNKVGMPFKGDYPISSPWGPPGSYRTITLDSGVTIHRRHGGTDFGTPSGTEILAIADGTVEKSDVSGKPGTGFGGRILIKHANKDYVKDPSKVVYSQYGHLQSRKVSAKATVKAGDVIGISGGGKNDPTPGGSKGPHLHLEVWVGRPYTAGSTREDRYGQGPPITQTQNATTGYTVPFFDWYIENARALGVTGVPQRTTEGPPKQSSGVNSDDTVESISEEAVQTPAADMAAAMAAGTGGP